MVVKQVFAVASAAFVAFSLSVTANGATLKITKSDENNKSSLVTWNVSGGGTAAPCKGNTYVVDTKLMVRTPNDKKTFSFAGDLLRIGSSDGDYGTLAPCRNSAIGTVTFPGVNGAAGLILEKGFIQPYKANSTMTIAGKVKVTALDSDPFVIRLVGGDTATNNQVVLSAALEGERSTMLRTLVYKQEKMRPSFVALDCDASNFMGTFDVYSYDKDRPCDCYLYNSHSLGGEIIVRKWSSLLPLYASTLWTIGTLRLEAGSTMLTKLTVNGTTHLPSTSTITLTESLTTSYPVSLTFPNGNGRTMDMNYGYIWDILTLPKTKKAMIHPEHFELTTQKEKVGLFPDKLPSVELRVTEKGDLAVLELVQRRVVQNRFADSPLGYDSKDQGFEFPTSLTNALAWTNNDLPSKDIDYIAAFNLNAAPLSQCDKDGDYVFPGASLTLSNKVVLSEAARCFTIPMLRLMDDSQFWPVGDPWEGKTAEVRGRIHAIPGGGTSSDKAALIRVRENTTARICAEITGEGRIQVQPNGPDKEGCHVIFDNDNSKFLGKIRITANNASVSDFKYGETLILKAANNAGGPLEGFTADALEIRRYSTLEVTNDVIFATANRGLTVNNARIKVGAGATFTFANDITYNGPLTKVGAGRLVLGGTAQGSAKTLTVEEGTLAVATDTALDGVAVTFTGGALAVNPTTSGAYGMRGPFTGNLPVAFDLPADEETHEYADVAVCTVDASANVTPKAVRIPRHRVVFHWRDNNDGTKTLLADISRTGCAIILR